MILISIFIVTNLSTNPNLILRIPGDYRESLYPVYILDRTINNRFPAISAVIKNELVCKLFLYLIFNDEPLNELCCSNDTIKKVNLTSKGYQIKHGIYIIAVDRLNDAFKDKGSVEFALHFFNTLIGKLMTLEITNLEEDRNGVVFNNEDLPNICGSPIFSITRAIGLIYNLNCLFFEESSAELEFLNTYFRNLELESSSKLSLEKLNELNSILKNKIRPILRSRFCFELNNQQCIEELIDNFGKIAAENRRTSSNKMLDCDESEPNFKYLMTFLFFTCNLEIYTDNLKLLFYIIIYETCYQQFDPEKCLAPNSELNIISYFELIKGFSKEVNSLYGIFVSIFIRSTESKFEFKCNIYNHINSVLERFGIVNKLKKETKHNSELKIILNLEEKLCEDLVYSLVCVILRS